jgi:hypothetical protein
MIRTNLRILVNGKTKEEVESNLKQRVAQYLSIDPEEVEEKTDIEMSIFVGEEGRLDLTFTAECSVRLK